MGLHAALYARLGAVSAYTDLVATRTYAERTPQKPTTPYVLFEVDDDTDPAHAMGMDTSLRRAWVRFYCLDTTGDAARLVSAALIAALRRYTGTSAGVVIDDCYIRGDRSIVDDDTKLLGRLVEFEICYQG
jgi:hypothetical protein